MKVKRAVVVGSINMDIILRVDKIPKIGETKIAEKMKISGGGKGANQAIAISRMGCSVSMIGKIGNDRFGRNLIDSLKASRVDIEGVIVDEFNETGTAYVTVDCIGENTIVVVPGSNSCLSIKDIDEKKEIICDSDIVILQMEIPVSIISYVMNLAKELGRLVILNFAPALDIDFDILHKVDFLILNEIEMLLIAELKHLRKIERDTINEAIKRIRNKFDRNIIITLGSNGCIWINEKGNILEIPAFPVKSIDSTGSGDAFVGGFVCGLLRGNSIKNSLKIGNAAGGLAVTKIGAQSSLPYWGDVESLMSNYTL